MKSKLNIAVAITTAIIFACLGLTATGVAILAFREGLQVEGPAIYFAEPANSPTAPAPTATPEAAEAPETAPALTAEELDLLIEARCANLELTPGMEGWVYVDEVEYECPAPAPIAPAVNDACYGNIDGSVVPYGGKVEFAASVVNTVEGPAVMEWWDGEGGAGHEGMFYVLEGQTLTLPRNVRGGYWQIVASSAMTAEEGLTQLIASHAHLVAFATKPQHDYVDVPLPGENMSPLAKALETCDWAELEDLLVFLPEGAVLK